LDAGTAAFYEAYAARLAPGYEAPLSAMLATVQATLPPGTCVLDVGAGAGRDMAAMLNLGLEAFGVEPCAAMRASALRMHPVLAGRLRDAMLPDLGQPFADLRPQGFDAVVCSAVLMHVMPTDLPRALASLAAQLRSPAEGAELPMLLISVPDMAQAQLQADRDADGRRFHNHPLPVLQTLLNALGFLRVRTHTSDAVLASTGTRWHTLVYRCR
jgi:SAM-dependent methyltransferase